MPPRPLPVRTLISYSIFNDLGQAALFNLREWTDLEHSTLNYGIKMLLSVKHEFGPGDEFVVRHSPLWCSSRDN